MIEVSNVSKSYRRHKVLDKVSFKIEGGEFVSIVGSSGAGKTTLIHALIGDEEIDSGVIKIDDYRISNLRPGKIQELRRRVGIIFQDYKLLPKKTVYENIAFALEVAGYPKKFIAGRTRDVMKLTGIEEKRNHFPNQLSGGEAQRTAIARALVHAPEVLIADEPTGNLDPDNAMALAQLFLDINKTGTTIILSTHNKEIVNLVKKRVITLKDGKLASDKKNSSYK